MSMVSKCFWSHFENKTDRSEISEVSKFNYLKEMLKLKVRTLIDGLPFTTESMKELKVLSSQNTATAVKLQMLTSKG